MAPIGERIDWRVHDLRSSAIPLFRLSRFRLTASASACLLGGDPDAFPHVRSTSLRDGGSRSQVP